MNSLLLRLNTKISNWNSTGGGNNLLTTNDIISALPNTISGQLLAYESQNKMPNKRLIDLIKTKCLKRYNYQIDKKARYYPTTKRLDSTELNKLVHMALTEIITKQTYTKRSFADELCEKQTTAWNNYRPIFEDFICLIKDGLYRAERKFRLKLG